MENAISNLRFIFLWIFGYIVAIFSTIASFVGIILLATFLLRFLIEQHPNWLSTESILFYSILIYSLVGLVFGWLFGSVQKSLLRQRTDEPWRGWLIASMIGGVLAANITLFLLLSQIIPYVGTSGILIPHEVLLWFALQLLTVPFGVLSLAQCFVLAGYVRSVWLWVLANLVGGVTLYGLLVAGAASWISGGFGVLLLALGLMSVPAIVTGFSMLWLINFNWKLGGY